MADRLIVDVSTDGKVSVSAVLDGAVPDVPVGLPVELASPLDGEALEDLRWYLEDYLVVPFGVYGDRGPEVAERLPEWGTALFDAVFGTGPARDLYKKLQGRAAPIELIVRSPSPAALGLPWELLQDPSRPTPLALDLAGMSRSLPGADLPAPFEASGDSLRVLMVIARPHGRNDVGYQMVARPLLRRLNAVRGQVELVVLRPPTIEAFEHALRTAREEGRPFQVVHFDGHGVGGGAGSPHMYSGEGLLVFEPSSGSDDGRVPADRFAAVLKEAQVPLVVLNACQSAAMGDQVEAVVATRLLQEVIAGVVAMGYSVYAVAAAEFMAAFYERLFAGDSVTAAVAAGRGRLALRPLRPSPKGQLPLSDWMVPVHYLRREVSFPHLVRTAVTPGALSLDDQLDRLRTASTSGDDGLAPADEFFGRDAELYDLERLARDRRVVVVHGPGGSGKTELANAFGRWWRATGGVGRPEWVVWHSFEPGIATFGLDGAVSAIGLQLFGPDFAGLDPADRRSVLLRTLRENRMLLLWDNVETVRTMPDPTGATPPLSDAECDDLNGFLAEVAAPGGKSTVLLTSRTPETWLGEVGRLGVGGLAEADRIEYADHLVGTDSAAAARRADPAFGQLLEWLSGHPLSMRLVLPLLATTDAATLLASLEGTEPLPVDADREESRTTSLAASITYSLDHLTKRERTLLTAVSLFHGVADADVLTLFSEADEVPDRFKGVENAEWVATLDHATEVGLLTAIGAGMYEIHPALPTFLAALWRTDHPNDHATERTHAIDALLSAYAQLCQWLRQQIETGDASLAFAVLDRQRRTLSHLLGRALASRRFSTAQALAEPLDEYWNARGLFPEADSWVDRIRVAVETPGGAPPPLDEPAGRLWLFAVSSEAKRDLTAGDLDQAERVYLQLFKLLELQPTDAEQQRYIAAVAHQLGAIVQDRGRLDDAENWYHKSLTVEEELGNRPGQAASYHQLGIIAQLRGRLDDAENWYHKSLTISEELGNRPAQAATYHQLGRNAQERGRLDDAENWYHKSLTVEEELGNRPGQATSYHQLGIIAQLRGRLDDAENWYHKSLAIKEELGNRPAQATTYRQLGIIAQLRGRLDDAENWYHKSLGIDEELGNRLGQAIAYHQLGIIAQLRGRLDDAENWCHKSLTIKEELGNRPGLVVTYGQLGILAERRGEPRGALNWAVRCVALFDEFPHPLTGPGPGHLVRLSGELGMPVLEEVWREVTGVALPGDVRRYVEEGGGGNE